jgi:hypothetical protein
MAFIQGAFNIEARLQLSAADGVLADSPELPSDR